jgi:hypothetical protein
LVVVAGVDEGAGELEDEELSELADGAVLAAELELLVVAPDLLESPLAAAGFAEE